jgi:nitrogen regulatory protein PII-like uncharacterized protein
MAGIEDLIRVYRGTENIPDKFKPLRMLESILQQIDTAKNYATRANTLSVHLTKEQFKKAKDLSKNLTRRSYKMIFT